VPEAKKHFTTDEPRRVGEEIGIDWSTAPFDVEQFRIGMNVELEHGLHDLTTNVTEDNPNVTAKIALTHLNEFSDCYTRLERMEEEATRDWHQRQYCVKRGARQPLVGASSGCESSRSARAQKAGPIRCTCSLPSVWWAWSPSPAGESREFIRLRR
jgi:hypothetical protein